MYLEVNWIRNAEDTIDEWKLAEDAVNSEPYTEGSIDTAHIADDQVTLAKMTLLPLL